MKIAVVGARDLTPDLVSAWEVLQKSDPRFDTPFFHPEYTQAVASVRDDVKVAVIEHGSEPVGFFPYMEPRPGVAVPVGDNLCDFDGVVIKPNLPWKIEQILRGAGISAWHFRHGITTQPEFQPHCWKLSESPYIELPDGFDGYNKLKKSAQSRSHREAGRKERKLAREKGELRLVFHTTDSSVFEKVISWKRDQYRRICSVDQLADEWTVRVLRKLAYWQGREFSGVMSAIYCGDDLFAAHLGMMCRGVLHGWFPVYNDDFHKWSPGVMLWWEYLKRSKELGIRKIDFGKGDEIFKQHMKTGHTMVAEGSIDSRPFMGTVRKAWFQSREWVRHSPLSTPAIALVRKVRSLRYGMAERQQQPVAPDLETHPDDASVASDSTV